jgi:hypothetical protein
MLKLIDILIAEPEVRSCNAWIFTRFDPVDRFVPPLQAIVAVDGNQPVEVEFWFILEVV